MRLWGGTYGRTETGENCPMWNHRSSAPPGPLPKKENRKEKKEKKRKKKRREKKREKKETNNGEEKNEKKEKSEKKASFGGSPIDKIQPHNERKLLSCCFKQVN